MISAIAGIHDNFINLNLDYQLTGVEQYWLFLGDSSWYKGDRRVVMERKCVVAIITM